MRLASFALLTALAVSIAAATAAMAQMTPPPKLVWLKTPTIEDVRRVYPPVALQKSISGGAMVGCDVAADGKLSSCTAYAAEPANMGFGEAAAALTSMFRLKPGANDQALLMPGRVALPMVLAAPGRSPPRLTFKLGDSAMLLTNVPFAPGQDATKQMGCLAADPPHRCGLHFLTWAERPNAMQALVSTLHAGADHGADLLICWVDPAGRLTACQASGQAAREVATDLAGQFKAPRLADDHTPVGQGPIMILLNWAPLSAAAQAMRPATTGAPAASGQ